MKRKIIGSKYENENGTELTLLYLGYWNEDRRIPENRRYWFEYPDNDVGSLYVSEFRERINDGTWKPL